MRVHTPHDATELGIATVYQDLALGENLDVVANLFLGPGGRQHRARSSHVLDEVGDGAEVGRAARARSG